VVCWQKGKAWRPPPSSDPNS